MATENQILIRGYEADADMSTKQYYVVVLTGTGANTKVDIATTATQFPFGILQNTPSANQTADVMIAGVSKFSGDGAVTINQFTKSSGDGQVAGVTTGTDSGLYGFGLCTEATSAADDVGSLLLLGARKI